MYNKYYTLPATTSASSNGTILLSTDNIFSTTSTVWLSKEDNVSVNADINSPIIDTLKEKLNKLEALFFREVVVKCPACGQWGAAMCECKYCGHPIDLGEVRK